MEQRLSKEVSRVRNQVLAFSNEGAELKLNVPDTEEVKGVFSELGMCSCVDLETDIYVCIIIMWLVKSMLVCY